MALKKYKPTSPGRRFMATSSFEEVTKTEPEKSLLEPLTKKGGRNNRGRITTRHQGGGHKRRFRTVDFKRTKDGVPAKVAAIEYDPNRSARIALLHYADGVKSYILAPARLRVGWPGNATATPVSTRWRRPDSRFMHSRSVASSSTFGRMRRPTATTVSAASTSAWLCRAATVSAFSIARRSACAFGNSPAGTLSSI